MIRRVKMRVFVLAAVAFLVASCSSGGSSGGKPTSTSPSALDPFKTDVAALQARWWTWTESFDPASNPIDDATGASCAEHQPTDVWFLAGTHGGTVTRQCTIPAGRPVFFPVLNQICSLGTGESVSAATARCKGRADQTDVTIDGAPLLPSEATSKTAFDFVAKADSSTGFAAGTHKAVAWGLWVGPLPLPSGKHSLHISGKSGSFSLDVTYELTVGGGA